MGKKQRVLKASELAPIGRLELPSGLRRRKPRSFIEWQSLHAWGRIPDWEHDPPGYLLKLLRHQAGLTQNEMAGLLGCSQQAVAQAERWQANPSVEFMANWARALGRRLELRFSAADRKQTRW